MERVVSVIGALAAIDQATLSVKVTGRLQSLTVDFGTRVQKGELVAQIEPVDYELKLKSAEALLAQSRARLGLQLIGTSDTVIADETSTVRQAKASLLESQKQRDRTRELVKRGISPQAELEVAEANYDIAFNKQLEAQEDIRQRQGVLQQRRAEVEIARQQLVDTRIVAPFDGIVQERKASPGEFLNTAAPIVTLVKVDPLRLRVEVPERNAAGVRPGQAVKPSDISFRLGPRINASGRLADAALSVELLLSEDPAFCAETARQLESFNRERQDIERGIIEEAERMIESEFAAEPGIVLFSENWHPGVVGIVAGRVTRKYNRPCVVLGNEGDTAKGSGRSVDGINLVAVLGTCCERLTSWGGHPMAVGIALNKTNLPEFRAAFSAAVRAHAGGDIAEAKLKIAAWLTPGQIRDRLMEELESLQPFGQGNPEPVFGVSGVVLRQRPVIFKDVHFRFTLEDPQGRRLHGVAWKMAHRMPPLGVPLDFAVELAWNHFNDRKLLQLELIDWREAQR